MKDPKAKPPAWMHDVGGPNAPAPGQQKDGQEHVKHGMFKQIAVK